LVPFTGCIRGQTWGVSWLFLIGTAIVLYTMFMWWRDVVKRIPCRRPHAGRAAAPALRHDDVHCLGDHVLRGVVLGLLRSLASMPTRSSRRRAVEVTQGVWPPAGIEVFDPWHLPLLNTLILLLSGTTVTWAHHALINGDRKGLKWGLICTIALGVLFSFVQAYEYSLAPFAFKAENGGNIYSSTFFMATGFHGFHVL
jgi:cytochrome c oxidase subunit 3